MTATFSTEPPRQNMRGLTVSVHRSKLLLNVSARLAVTRMRVLHMVKLEHVSRLEWPCDTHLDRE